MAGVLSSKATPVEPPCCSALALQKELQLRVGREGHKEKKSVWRKEGRASGREKLLQQHLLSMWYVPSTVVTNLHYDM